MSFEIYNTLRKSIQKSPERMALDANEDYGAMELENEGLMPYY